MNNQSDTTHYLTGPVGDFFDSKIFIFLRHEIFFFL